MDVESCVRVLWVCECIMPCSVYSFKVYVCVCVCARVCVVWSVYMLPSVLHFM